MQNIPESYYVVRMRNSRKIFQMSLNVIVALPDFVWMGCSTNSLFALVFRSGAAVKMEHIQAALDPRKQELLEARFLGARVSRKPPQRLAPSPAKNQPQSRVKKEAKKVETTCLPPPFAEIMPTRNLFNRIKRIDGNT